MLRFLLAFFFLSPLAKAGPGVSGGGDFAADRKATPAETRAAIADARRVLPFVWKAIEAKVVEARAQGTADYAPIPKAVIDALFPWPKPKPDVYAVEDKIELVIQEKAPCRDAQGAAKAASAYPFEARTICFSVPLIVKESTHTNLLRRVTALLAHELAHKMGVHDEAGAEALESEITARLPADPLALVRARHEAVRAFETADLAGFKKTVVNLTKDIEAGMPDVELCLRVGMLAGASARTLAHGNFEPYLLAFHRPNYQAEAKAIAVRGALLPGYCVQGAGQKALSANDPVLSILNLRPRAPVVGDRSGLRAEIESIAASLAKLEYSLGLNGKALRGN